jgi:hypothetical protein
VDKADKWRRKIMSRWFRFTKISWGISQMGSAFFIILFILGSISFTRPIWDDALLILGSYVFADRVIAVFFKGISSWPETPPAFLGLCRVHHPDSYRSHPHTEDTCRRSFFESMARAHSIFLCLERICVRMAFKWPARILRRKSNPAAWKPIAISAASRSGT